MSNEPTTIWKQLHTSTNPQAQQWVDRFQAYNAQIGNALAPLSEQSHSIKGRDKEIEMLYAILERPKTPVALLLGHAGVGKTALVEEFAKQLNSGTYNTALNYKYLLLSLRVGSLASIGTSKLQAALSNLLDQLKAFELLAQKVLNDDSIRIVLFIDEVHMIVTIFGPGTKIGGDVIKDVLARSPIRVIAATTRREYDSTIIVDKPLSERFKQLEMHELAPDIVEQICLNWWSKNAPECTPPSTEVLQTLINANAMYRSDSAEPRKSLDILEDLVSYVRRTGNPATIEQLSSIFKQRYSINLDFSVSADDVYHEIEKRIKGQPHALWVLRRALRAMVFQLDATSNKPMLTLLLTGPTGVGKTETMKAIAQSLYPGEPVLQFINMPDFRTADHEMAFRKKLGEAVRHTPNSIVLLDEFEKAHNSIKDSMLTILDEGIVTYEVENREGAIESNHVSLRNTIIAVTTNAGSNAFSDDAKFSLENDSGHVDANNSLNRAKMEQLLISITQSLLANEFKPEMLGRFNRIIPYRALSKFTLIDIAASKIDIIKSKLNERNGITLLFNEPQDWSQYGYQYTARDVDMYIATVRAKSNDSNSGGARAIDREIQTYLYDTIVDAIIEYPEYNTFKVYVSQDSQIYQPGAARTAGGIIVEPVAP